MKHLLVLLVCILSVEILIRLNFLSVFGSILKVTRKVFWRIQGTKSRWDQPRKLGLQATHAEVLNRNWESQDWSGSLLAKAEDPGGQGWWVLWWSIQNSLKSEQRDEWSIRHDP